LNVVKVSVFRYSAWEYREERGQFYLHQFVIGQPDMNYRNPKVLEEMKDVFRFWLDLGVDGFRMDAVSYPVQFKSEKACFSDI
jgi:alpha-glucosidase